MSLECSSIVTKPIGEQIVHFQLQPFNPLNTCFDYMLAFQGSNRLPSVSQSPWLVKRTKIVKETIFNVKLKKNIEVTHV